jgi:hypothetical protein
VFQAPKPARRRGRWLSCSRRSRADLAAGPLFVAVRQLWLLGLQLANTDRWGRSWVTEGYFDFHLKILREWSSFRFPRGLNRASPLRPS